MNIIVQPIKNLKTNSKDFEQTQLHPEYSGPRLGPKMATENKRNFSEEEIRRLRDSEIGLQVKLSPRKFLYSFNFQLEIILYF